MIKKLKQKFWSWWWGNKIGDSDYEKASPFFIGNILHFLPTDSWSNQERKTGYFCFNKSIWNGTNWIYSKRVKISMTDIDKAKEEKLSVKEALIKYGIEDKY